MVEDGTGRLYEYDISYYMYTVHTYFADSTQLFLVFHHVSLVVRALVSLANRVDGFV